MVPAAPVHPTDPVQLDATARFDYVSAPRKNKAPAHSIMGFTCEAPKKGVREGSPRAIGDSWAETLEG